MKVDLWPSQTWSYLFILPPPMNRSRSLWYTQILNYKNQQKHGFLKILVSLHAKIGVGSLEPESNHLITHSLWNKKHPLRIYCACVIQWYSCLHIQQRNPGSVFLSSTLGKNRHRHLWILSEYKIAIWHYLLQLSKAILKEKQLDCPNYPSVNTSNGCITDRNCGA